MIFINDEEYIHWQEDQRSVRLNGLYFNLKLFDQSPISVNLHIMLIEIIRVFILCP